MVTNLESKAGDVKKIHFNGSSFKERFLVQVGGVDVLLTGVSFRYLITLAFNLTHNDNGGWVHKDDLEKEGNCFRYFYRLRGELRNVLKDSSPRIENDGCGNYRLDASPDKVTFNEKNLGNHPDYGVRKFFANT